MMKHMAFACVAAGLMASAFASNAFAQPVAYACVPVPANTDTLVSVPVVKRCVGEFTVASVSGNAIELTGSSIQTYSTNSQGRALYYARVVDGPLCGQWFDIEDQSGDTVFLNVEDTPASGASVLDNGASGLQVGDTVAIIEKWTMACLFPDGFLGLTHTASPSPFSVQFTVFLPYDSDGVGVNTPAATQVFYLAGATNAWLFTNGTPADNAVLEPQGVAIIRNTNAASTGNPDDPETLQDESTGDLSFYVTGECKTIKVIECVPTEAVDNDARLGAANLFATTLDTSGLLTAITPSPSPFSISDSVIVVAPPVQNAGFNPPQSAQFFNFGGTFFTTGGAPAGTTPIGVTQTLILRKDGVGVGADKWVLP